MGKRYIIELEDEVNGLCKAKGFNTLVFDRNGISKLTPYEEQEEKPNARWKPKVGDWFYYLIASGDVNQSCWHNGKTCQAIYALGNCFRTKEEAEFAAERLKVIAELSEYAEPKDAPWDGQEHISVSYDTADRRFVFKSWYAHKTCGLFFASERDAQIAIEAVGRERVLKYYLGVE